MEFGPVDPGEVPRRSSDRVDLAWMRFSFRDVVVIFTIIVTVGSAAWALSGRMDVIVAKMDARERLEDERAATLKDAIADLRRRQELLEYEVRNGRVEKLK